MGTPSSSPDFIPSGNNTTSLVTVDGWSTIEAIPMENVTDVTIYAQVHTDAANRHPDGRYKIEGLRLVFLTGEDTPGEGDIVNIFTGSEVLGLRAFDLIQRIDKPDAPAYQMILSKQDALRISRFIDLKVNLYL